MPGEQRVRISLFGKVEGRGSTGEFEGLCFTQIRHSGTVHYCPSLTTPGHVGCVIQEAVAISGISCQVRVRCPWHSRTPSCRLLPRKNADSIGFDKGLGIVLSTYLAFQKRHLYGIAWLRVVRCFNRGPWKPRNLTAVPSYSTCVIVPGFWF